MKENKRFLLLCVFSMAALASAMAADSVPAVTAMDFADTSPVAGFIWSLLAQPEAGSIIIAAIGGLVGIVCRNRYVRKWRLERASEFLGAGVRETYEEYVRNAQKANADGKLTAEERNIAMQMAISKAKEYCLQNGLDLLKIYAKEFLPVLVERIIGVQKTYGRAVPFPGLPELEPHSFSAGS